MTACEGLVVVSQSIVPISSSYPIIAPMYLCRSIEGIEDRSSSACVSGLDCSPKAGSSWVARAKGFSSLIILVTPGPMCSPRPRIGLMEVRWFWNGTSSVRCGDEGSPSNGCPDAKRLRKSYNWLDESLYIICYTSRWASNYWQFYGPCWVEGTS